MVIISPVKSSVNRPYKEVHMYVHTDCIHVRMYVHVRTLLLDPAEVGVAPPGPTVSVNVSSLRSTPSPSESKMGGGLSPSSSTAFLISAAWSCV